MRGIGQGGGKALQGVEMRAVVQRVLEGSVTINEGEETGRIGKGLVVLLGVGPEDDRDDVRTMADRIAHLRVFPDESG
jgi:D-aminoacyl-tRNA deacylase